MLSVAWSVMMLFKQFLDWLNRYANLLLVFVTISYVWLTWRNMKALQRASLREREQRHLEDIKQCVVRPLIKWIDSEAVAKLRGRSPLVEVKTIPVPKPTAPLGEWSYDYTRQLDSALGEPGGISSALLLHATEAHFRTQLSEFEVFRKTVWQVVSDCVALARDCADRSTSSTSLQRAAADLTVAEAANSDSLVEICLRDILFGRPKPQIGFQSPNAGALQVTDGYSRSIIGKGPEELVRSWAESGVARVQDEWARSGLREKIEAVLRDAANVRRTLEAVEFTYALPGDCEYVGGRKA
jgi:hypothetical protein